MIPEIFEKRMEMLLGDEYSDFIDCYKKNKYQGLRVNTLKIDTENFIKISPFELKGKVPWEYRGFYIEEDKPGKSPYHAVGLYYVQEPSAMSSVPYLKIEKGQKVLDLCAAPGGKTAQAACDLDGEGILISNEIDLKRSKILSENVERMGIKNSIVLNNSPKDLTNYFFNYFDKIIVDAPCSGEGMFRKDEQVANEWSTENVKGCAIRQSEILESADKMLKGGGRIIYSTCTFSLEENEMVINDFINKHDNYRIVEIEKNNGFSNGFGEKIGNINLNMTARLFPHKVRGEGHFICLLEKHCQEETSPDIIKSNMDKSSINLVTKFISENNINFNLNGVLFRTGDEVNLLPTGLPTIKGLRVIRAGLHLGTLKKDRFEPSHSFALCLKKNQIVNCLDFNLKDDNIYRYLSGNTLSVENMDGWCLVCVDGYSLGWGKISKNVLKNHYPKGLRW